MGDTTIKLAEYLGVRIEELESVQRKYIPCRCTKWFTLEMVKHDRDTNMILTNNFEQIWYDKKDGKYQLFIQFPDAKYPIGTITEEEFKENFI